MHGNWALNLLRLGFQFPKELLVLIIIDNYQSVVRRAGYQIITLADDAGDFATSVDLGPPYDLLIFQVKVLDDAILSAETENGVRVNRSVYFRYSCDLMSVSVQEYCLLVFQAKKTQDFICHIDGGHIALAGFSDSHHVVYGIVVLQRAKRLIIKRVPHSQHLI